MAYQDPHFSAPAQQSPWKAIFRVITEPAATFSGFAGRVPIFPGYLAQMLVATLSVLIALPVTMRVLEKTMLNNPAYTPQMAEFTKWSGIIGGVFGGLATPWIAGLFVALIALFFGQFQEERVPYTSYLGMLGYARAPLMIGSLLSAVLMLALGERAVTMSLSLAALAPAGTGAALKALLASINPFDLWYYFVLATGFGALHRGTARKGLALVVTLWLLSALFSMATSGLASRFTPGAM